MTVTVVALITEGAVVKLIGVLAEIIDFAHEEIHTGPIIAVHTKYIYIIILKAIYLNNKKALYFNTV